MPERAARSLSGKVLLLPEPDISTVSWYSTANVFGDSRILGQSKRPPDQSNHHFGREVGVRRMHSHDKAARRSSLLSHVPT
jgi:hypothetical protein